MMKVAVVVLALLVGASMAKPSLDDKLIKLLKKVLQDKDALQVEQKDEESKKWFFSGSGSGFFAGSGSGFFAGSGSGYVYGGAGDDPVDTTLFNGLDAFPFHLFHDLHEITDPLNVIDMEGFEGWIKGAVDGVEGIGEELDNKIKDFDAEGKSLREVAWFVLDDLIFKTVYNSPEGDLTELMGHIFISLVKGAVAGTIGAPLDEPGCDFDKPERKMVPCALNKAFLAMYACVVFMEEEFEKLELRECDQTWKYIEENQGDLDPEDMFDSLKATSECVTHNLEEVRKQIGFRDMPNLPAENRPAPGPLNKLIRANALLQFYAGAEWWTDINLWMVVGAIHEQDPSAFAELDKKKMLHLREKSAKRMDNKYLTSKRYFQARGYKNHH